MKQVIVFLIILTFTCLSQLTCLAAIIHVPVDQPTIQAGIDAAVDGDTVLVADGTYTGDGNRNISFKGKAITVTSENGPEQCVIDCGGTSDLNYGGFHFYSGENSGSVLRGLGITGSYEIPAIRCDGSSPLIYNCDIHENDSNGIYLYYSSSQIDSCQISSNRAERGAGIYCLYSTPFISNSDIVQNDCRGIPFGAYAGGIYSRGSTAIFVSCTIIGNGGRCWWSGGVACSVDDSSYFYNCIISNNSTAGDTPSDGSGITCFEGSSPSFINCTVSKNFPDPAIFCQTRSYATFRNCIVWEDEPFDIDRTAKPDITYCNIKGGLPGIGNINAEPRFINDYYLSPESPCIDAGTDYQAPTFDLEGNPRPSGGAVDMGAYEYHGWPSIPRVYVKMPSHVILPGDRVKCLATVWNPYDEALSDHRLFVVLEAFGQLFMAPSFSEFDSYPWSFGPGRTIVFVLPEFEWPDNVGSASDVIWYACLTNTEMTELASPIGVYDFEWSE